MGMKRNRRVESRLEGLVVWLLIGLAFVACVGGASREPSNNVTQGPTHTSTPSAAATPEAGRAETPLPTVSPEELPVIGGDPAREGEIDPCSLVMEAEVEEIIEQQVVDVWRHARFFRVCEYFTDPDVEPFGSATIRLESNLSPGEFEEQIDEMDSDIEAELDVPKARAVSGIAEAAYSFGPVLWVYQEGTMLVLTVIVRDKPDLDAAKELASIALRRLPSPPLATATPLPTVSPEELSTIGGDPPPPEGEIDPCTLIARGEAEAILELPVAHVWRHTHFGGGNICEWYSLGNPHSSIFLRLDEGRAAAELLAIYRMQKPAWPELQDLSGIGDLAYTLGQELLVLERGTLFSLLVVVKDEPSLDAAKELASIAFRRLPQGESPSP